jgi:hypothetical protein
MKAKLVNEVQNFERGLDPKEAMGTGYSLEDLMHQFVDDIEREFDVALHLTPC